MNPFDEKVADLNHCIADWKEMRPAPYDKREVDPYTRTRVILMNGTEFEANWFLHQFSRHCDDNDVRRELALIRRLEQQQQKLISVLKPLDETILEHTIGYEQLAVDLTAALAKRENDPNVKNALDFALLEDFDHLYRYADLMNMETGAKAEDIVGRYTEITPGRPTISEHRYPYDDIKKHIDDKTASLQTKLCVNIITAAEQQTMNFYMNVCGAYSTDMGRKLYQEIGMIEEQHVSQYGSLIDTTATWAECLLTHQYVECYLYYSCMETETDNKVKKIWERLFEQELCHLQAAKSLLERMQGKDYHEVVGNGIFPQPLALASNIDYVRGVLGKSVQLTATRESYACVDALKPEVDFFMYQDKVNKNVGDVTSHVVINEHIKKLGEDYRFETAPNPVEQLRDRKRDDTDVGRTKGAAQGCSF